MRSDKLYTEVGKAIDCIQLNDKIFKIVLTAVFPGKELNDIDLINKNDKLLRKATLGILIKTLKKRVSINDSFEGILNSYLDDRNSLVHNWDEIEGWNNEEIAVEFAINVQRYALSLLSIFSSFLRSWMEQVDITEINENFPELEEFFNMIDNIYKPFLSGIVVNIKNN